MSLDALMRLLVPRGWFVPGDAGHPLTSPSAARSPPTSTARTTTSTAASPTTSSSITLRTPKGVLRGRRPTRDPELFWATAGGMGLTGIVTEVDAAAAPDRDRRCSASTPSAPPTSTTSWRGCASGDDALPVLGGVDRLPGRAARARPFGAAARRPRAARRSCRRAARARPAALRAAHPPRGAAVGAERAAEPVHDPRLQRGVVPAAARTSDAGTSRRSVRSSTRSTGSRGWNRIYGSRGFVQYQYVVPDHEHETVRRTLERLSARAVRVVPGRAEAVRARQPGPLSFPTPGWTLALDIPAGRRASSPSCSTSSTSWSPTPAAASTWPRTRACAPSSLPVMYPSSTGCARCAQRVDPSNVLQSDLARRLGLL